ncbi:TPA: hypothetical protein ACUK6B_005329, partial [Escherichia coli]
IDIWIGNFNHIIKKDIELTFLVRNVLPQIALTIMMWNAIIMVHLIAIQHLALTQPLSIAVTENIK